MPGRARPGIIGTPPFTGEPCDERIAVVAFEDREVALAFESRVIHRRRRGSHGRRGGRGAHRHAARGVHMSFNVTNPAKPTIDKDPDAVLDYSFDWSLWICDDDTITAFETLATGSLVVESTAIESIAAIPGDPEADPPGGGAGQHITTAVVSGGTPGATETVTHRITTAEGRIDDRTMYFKVKER